MTGLIGSTTINDIWPLEWFPAGVQECDSIDESNKIGRGISLFHILENRLQRCIATINRWTDYCNNREIIVVIIGCLKKIAK